MSRRVGWWVAALAAAAVVTEACAAASRSSSFSSMKSFSMSVRCIDSRNFSSCAFKPSRSRLTSSNCLRTAELAPSPLDSVRPRFGLHQFDFAAQGGGAGFGGLRAFLGTGQQLLLLVQIGPQGFARLVGGFGNANCTAQFLNDLCDSSSRALRPSSPRPCGCADSVRLPACAGGPRAIGQTNQSRTDHSSSPVPDGCLPETCRGLAASCRSGLAAWLRACGSALLFRMRWAAAHCWLLFMSDRRSTSRSVDLVESRRRLPASSKSRVPLTSRLWVASVCLEILNSMKPSIRMDTALPMKTNRTAICSSCMMAPQSDSQERQSAFAVTRKPQRESAPA